MGILRDVPNAAEVLVKRVRFQQQAEARGECRAAFGGVSPV
jgi:hypothetical protein